MHAVVVKVTVRDREAAEAELHERVVPGVSGAPGFVGGYWVALPDGHGTSIIAFESEEGARAAAEQVQAPRDAVTIDSVVVGEVVAHA